MPCQVYAYQPVRSEAGIRVLLLEPAKDHNAQLYASLQHVQINPYRQDGTRATYDIPSARTSMISLLDTTQVQYEAISYAWGDQQPTERLAIQGSTPHQFIMIKPNVGTMLRYLRSPRQQRWLWIDALCINQENLEEKGAQVRFMEEIYRQAKGIVIWVGTPPDAPDPKAATARLFQLLVKYGPADNRPEQEQAATWEKLEAILSRAWFTRRWTIQEALLAKQAIMMCGSSLMNFMVFAKNAFLTAQRQSRLDPSLSAVLRKLWIMYKLRSAPVSEVRSDPLRLLIDFSTADCTDPRDRIFALNAVSNVKASVSYTDTAEQVYKSYAAMHISLGNFAILNCAGAMMSAESPLPSWVPDWRCPLVFTPLVTRPVLGTNKSYDPNDIAVLGMDGPAGRIVLDIHGIKLGTTAFVGDKAPYPVWGGSMLQILLDWYQTFESGAKEVTKRLQSKSATDNEFVSTITLGTVAQRTTALSPDHPWLRDKHPDYQTDVPWLLAHLISETLDNGPHRSEVSRSYAMGFLGSDAQTEAQKIIDIEAKASQISVGLKTVLKSLMLNTTNCNADIDIQHDIALIWSFKDPFAKEGWYDRNLEPDEVVEILRRTIAGRTCFWTSDGTFGLGPATMQAGDIIVAVPSCLTPYVLRPKAGDAATPTRSSSLWRRKLGKPSDEIVQGPYTLVGDCYIHDYAPVDVFKQHKELRKFHVV
jgi:hypothetical protein